MLIGHDSRVRVHSAVIAAASNMFKSLLSAQSHSLSSEFVINLPSTDKAVLEAAVEFSYLNDFVTTACLSSKQTTDLQELGLKLPSSLLEITLYVLIVKVIQTL